MKAHFATQLHVSPVPHDDLRWRLDFPLCYVAGAARGGGQVIEVPTGFVTDFASIPRVFWRLILPTGTHREAAVVHDWLYHCGDRERVVADAIFFEAMRVCGVPAWRRWAMFLAVRVGGWGAWRSHRRSGHKPPEQ
jgi:hypothetical protein